MADLAATQADPDVLKSGMLDRKGLVLGRWARRFFILQDCFLFVCKARPESLAAGVAQPDHVLFLNTPGADVRAAPAGSGTKNHPWMFVLSVTQPSKEEHMLAAPSEAERASWIEALLSCIRTHAGMQNESSSFFESARTASPASQGGGGIGGASSTPSSRPGSRAGSPSGDRSGGGATSRLPRPQLRGGPSSLSSSLEVNVAIAASPSRPASASAMPPSASSFTLRARRSALEEAEGEEGDDASFAYDDDDYDNGGGDDTSASFPPIAAAAATVPSAVDAETRSKLRQIEASSSDPVLLSLLAEQQVLDEKISKLKLHKKVLAAELKVASPRLAEQTRVQSGLVEEIALYRTLQSKRTAHRIQVAKWVASVEARLQKSEPSAFLKQQRRAQVMHMQQQQQLQRQQRQQQQQQFQSSPSSSPPLHSHLASSSSFSAGSAGAVGFAPAPAFVPYSSEQLLRLSNTELDTLEREVRAHRPAGGPSRPDLLTALQREEIESNTFEIADASKPARSLSQVEQQWTAARKRSEAAAAVTASSSSLSTDSLTVDAEPRSTSSSPLPPSSSSSSATYTSLLQNHTSTLNDVTHLLVSILLREIDIRRQLNLLQGGIHKITSEKESSFRQEHATAAAVAAALVNKETREKKLALITRDRGGRY